jgi:hypothetical protein
VDFRTLSDLILAVGVFAGGFGLVCRAWVAADTLDTRRELAASMRDHAESNRQLGDAINHHTHAVNQTRGRTW